MQRFLDPRVLAGINGLDLIAKTVVDGFVTGLHKSPDFGFSQEFAEYRAYTPGDDLRHVDWNLFARTDRMYLKRYRGETNSQLTILLDASNSMQFASHGVSKMDYARYAAAALFYLAIHNQRDPAGLVVFDDEVREFIRPSTRAGQLPRLLAGSRAGRAAGSYQLRTADEVFSGAAAAPRHGPHSFGLLRRSGVDHQDHRAVALPRQRGRALPHSGPAGDRAEAQWPVHPGRSRNRAAHGGGAGLCEGRVPPQDGCAPAADARSHQVLPAWTTTC